MDADSFNIAAYLPEMAARQPDALAVVVQRRRGAGGAYAYTRLSAKELDDESNRIARGLDRAGIGPGTRTVLMVPPGLAFFSLTFALFKIGGVPVLVDPGMGTKNLKACLSEAQPEAFIGIPKAHAARVLLGWARDSIRTNVTVGLRWFWGGRTLDSLRDRSSAPVMAETRAEATAAILFTSGSTGVPKGAVYTHGNFDAQVKALRDDYGIKAGEKDLATFPLFALFGPALGMATIVPDMDASKPITADPRNIIAAVKAFGATNLFASPALIETVGRYGVAKGVRLPTLRRVISAGAPAEPHSLTRFATMLDEGVEVFPSYGATEALPVARISHTELIEDTAEQTHHGAGVCVGRPVGSTEIRIIHISDDPISTWSSDLELPQGAIGEICVKGPVVTRQYYNRPQSTALAKIADPATNGVWHRMGDVGYLDGDGRLWFCGRKSHRVRIDGQTLFTIPCERIFNAHPGVRRTALIGATKNGAAVPVLCVELEPGAPESGRAQLGRELLGIAGRHKQTAAVRDVLFHPGFPVDVRHNAKIFREKLAEWAKEQLS